MTDYNLVENRLVYSRPIVLHHVEVTSKTGFTNWKKALKKTAGMLQHVLNGRLKVK